MNYPLTTKEYLIHLENIFVIKIAFMKTQGFGNCIVCNKVRKNFTNCCGVPQNTGLVNRNGRWWEQVFLSTLVLLQLVIGNLLVNLEGITSVYYPVVQVG